MIDVLVQATENFCKHQLRTDCVCEPDMAETRTLIAYLDVTTRDQSLHRVYVVCEVPLMQSIALLFLGEDESDDETLIDLTLETTNTIVGSAKVLAEESDTPFSIATPHFDDNATLDAQQCECRTLRIGDHRLTLAIKDL